MISPHTHLLICKQWIIHLAPPLPPLSQLIVVPISPPYSDEILLCFPVLTTTYHMGCSETGWNRIGKNHSSVQAFLLLFCPKEIRIWSLAYSLFQAWYYNAKSEWSKTKSTHFPQKVTREEHYAEHLFPPLSADRRSSVCSPRLKPQFSSLFQNLQKTVAICSVNQGALLGAVTWLEM